MIGILPTIRQSDLVMKNVSALRRYTALNEQILRRRNGRPIQLAIDGDQVLRITHADVMLEAATTSFQVHLQVPGAAAVRFYNASLVASAPVLAIGTNSPFLLGHRLWHETRVPLFEQAVATESGPTTPENRRVTFGCGYLRESIAEHFEDVTRRFPVLLPLLCDDDSSRFSHLRLHNGTVWHWNRPLIGFDDDGTTSVRIEHRVLPAGPSLLDMVANAAFYVGLVSALATLSRPVEADLSFYAARNFYAAARDGLGARIVWLDGRLQPMRALLLEELLPIARQGLRGHGVDPDEIERWVGIVDQRVRSGRTGSAWQRAFIDQRGPDFQRMLAEYLEHQRARPRSRVARMTLHVVDEVPDRLLDVPARSVAEVLPSLDSPGGSAPTRAGRCVELVPTSVMLLRLPLTSARGLRLGPLGAESAQPRHRSTSSREKPVS